MSNWYIKRGTETAGPLTQDRLKELAALGKIQETDLIREGETGPFIAANQISGLLLEKGSEAGIAQQSQYGAPVKKVIMHSLN